jgi:hypothetical protein
MQLGHQVGELLLDVDERIEVLLDAEGFDGGEIQVAPPVTVVNGEGIAWWRVEMVAMENGVELILETGLLSTDVVHPHDLATVSDECAELANGNGRHPDLGDQVGGQQLGQPDGGVLVGLDSGGGDPLDLEGVGDDAVSDKGSEKVVGLARRVILSHRLPSDCFQYRMV